MMVVAAGMRAALVTEDDGGVNFGDRRPFFGCFRLHPVLSISKYFAILEQKNACERMMELVEDQKKKIKTSSEKSSLDEKQRLAL
ncbi:hypothetical protein L1987_59584 [Smallanthus sonchifolius]|uniref:Uncharacterized protein n=1 Tax=Smallanthus sonchifolius TaxID=185202 RepID=A0ACB9D639_9ASTR|nr:hypothetical protein L1987_59584 [Smallanthus sonchifolius]